MYKTLNRKLIGAYLQVRALLFDRSGELDEKAILIAFFVIIVAGAVTLLGSRVSMMVRNLANMV